MLTFSLILFLDGKFIHNGFLSNLRSILWLRINQHLKLNISKRLFFNIEKWEIQIIRFYYVYEVNWKLNNIVNNKGFQSIGIRTQNPKNRSI
jgi:hypothetical protein